MGSQQLCGLPHGPAVGVLLPRSQLARRARTEAINSGATEMRPLWPSIWTVLVSMLASQQLTGNFALTLPQLITPIVG